MLKPGVCRGIIIRRCLIGVIWLLALLAGARTLAQLPRRIDRTPPATGVAVKPPLLWVLPGEAINRWQGTRLLSLWRGDVNRREVTLTFDDGPHPAFTARLLDLLKREKVKATFFVVGKKVDEAPETVARIVREGHEVGNHTYNHVNLDKLSREQAEKEISHASASIQRACGIKPLSFRPPGGHHSEIVYQAAAKQGARVVFWTDDPGDFAKPAPDVIMARTLKDLGNGSDILLHDGIEQTLQMLPALIARLRRDGYQFVTVSEMARHLETSHRGK